MQLQPDPRADTVPTLSTYRDLTQRDPPLPLVGLMNPPPIIAEDPSPNVTITEEANTEMRSNPDDTNETFHSLAVESSDPESANCSPRKRDHDNSNKE